MPGPPPKDPEKRARRNAALQLTLLPAAGRAGRAPNWPLPPDLILTSRLAGARARAGELRLLADDPDLSARKRSDLDQRAAAAAQLADELDAQLTAQTSAERAVWTTLWRTPMAVQWARLRWVREVALYARWSAKAEAGDLRASAEARLRAETLGLTPSSLLRLRWRVEDATTPAERAANSPLSGARARYAHLRAVPDPTHEPPTDEEHDDEHHDHDDAHHPDRPDRTGRTGRTDGGPGDAPRVRRPRRARVDRPGDPA